MLLDRNSRNINLKAAQSLTNFARESMKRKKLTLNISEASGMDQKVQEYIYKILMKPSIQRGEDENKIVINFLESIDTIYEIRDQVTEDNMRSLSLFCKLVEFKEMDIICRYGDASSSVYYILEGEIAVTTMNQAKYTKENLSLNTLSTVPAKNFFGEAGVLSKSVRTANCVCKVPSKILVIEGRAYIDTVGKIMMSYKQMKVAFLARVSLFDLWEYPKLSAFHDSIRNQKICPHYGHLIFNEGQYPEMIYLVIRGQVEICMYPPRKEQKDNDDPLATRTLLLKSTKPRGALIPLLTLGEASYFGDENNKDENKSQCFVLKVVSQECELYFMKRSVLMMNVQKNPLQQQNILKHFKSRQEYLKAKRDEYVRRAKDDGKLKPIKPGYETWIGLVQKREEPNLADPKQKVAEESLITGFVSEYERCISTQKAPMLTSEIGLKTSKTPFKKGASLENVRETPSSPDLESPEGGPKKKSWSIKSLKGRHPIPEIPKGFESKYTLEDCTFMTNVGSHHRDPKRNITKESVEIAKSNSTLASTSNFLLYCKKKITDFEKEKESKLQMIETSKYSVVGGAEAKSTEEPPYTRGNFLMTGYDLKTINPLQKQKLLARLMNPGSEVSLKDQRLKTEMNTCGNFFSKVSKLHAATNSDRSLEPGQSAGLANCQFNSLLQVQGNSKYNSNKFPTERHLSRDQEFHKNHTATSSFKLPNHSKVDRLRSQESTQDDRRQIFRSRIMQSSKDKLDPKFPVIAINDCQ